MRALFIAVVTVEIAKPINYYTIDFNLNKTPNITLNISAKYSMILITYGNYFFKLSSFDIRKSPKLISKLNKKFD